MKYFIKIVRQTLALSIILYSCGNNKKPSSTGDLTVVANDDTLKQPAELIYKEIDKYNITVGDNYIVNNTHRVKIFKPSDWTRLTGTSQYTAIKIAQTEYGAQVSINWKEPINHKIDDAFLDTEMEEFKNGLSAAGIELQNVIQNQINYKNDRARRIDATWLKSIGDITYIEKVIFISIIHEGKMITIGCTFPEKLQYLFSENLDRIINSIEFID
jgi:hypothetical protein